MAVPPAIAQGGAAVTPSSVVQVFELEAPFLDSVAGVVVPELSVRAQAVLLEFEGGVLVPAVIVSTSSGGGATVTVIGLGPTVSGSIGPTAGAAGSGPRAFGRYGPNT